MSYLFFCGCCEWIWRLLLFVSLFIDRDSVFGGRNIILCGIIKGSNRKDLFFLKIRNLDSINNDKECYLGINVSKVVVFLIMESYNGKFFDE